MPKKVLALSVRAYTQIGGEQGWCSGESARLPPMWPEFDSRSRCHMWVEYVVGSRPCSEGFSPGSSVFLPSWKTNISKFQFDLDRGPAWKPARADVASSLNIVILSQVHWAIIPSTLKDPMWKGFGRKEINTVTRCWPDQWFGSVRYEIDESIW